MMGPLLTAWRAPAATPAPPRRVWRDWLVVGVFGTLVVVETLLRWTEPWVPLSGAVLLAVVPTLLWRRQHPLAMLLVAFGATEALGLVSARDSELGSSGFLMVLVYAVFRWGTGRARIITGALLAVSTAYSLTLTQDVVPALIGTVAILGPIVLLGVLFRQRAIARVRELESVRSHERAQLARDLHDIVAHHVSAITVQAQAGIATASTNPAAALTALETIELEASRTLSEMRAMVRTLRDTETAALAPLPGVRELRALADARHSPSVTVRIAGAADELPPTIAAAVFRIAQESVTNARRHARGATLITVDLVVDADGARLTVRDNGEGGPVGSGGFGIPGMTERASLLGGGFEGGPHDEGGWATRVVLPRAGWTA